MTQISQGKPSRADVINAYQVMLGRAPESEASIESHLSLAPGMVDLIRNIAGSREFAARLGVGVSASSPFFHFNASVDVGGIVASHVRLDREPVTNCFVNFLNVAVPTKVMSHLADKGGQLDQIPIPANFHADMSEWAAALRAVDLAHDEFVMVELGCGWGCWMNNTGVAAKHRGIRVHLIGVEGDKKHLDFARETFEINRISSSEYLLMRGVAAAGPGIALFPRQGLGEETWGSEPIFDVSEAEAEAAVATGRFDSLRMIPLVEVIADRQKVDLLHMDIQGGEANLVAETIDLLSDRVAYLVIGTHSRAIEGRLLTTLLDAGWQLEIERPAIFGLVGGKPQTTVDGVQGWRNPKHL